MSGSNQWRISEKMKLLLSSLLLLGSLCAISSRSASCTDIVTQTPDVSVREGDALNITCCFNSTSERMKFKWLKNQTEIGNQSSVLNNRSQGSQRNPSCSTLTFSNIEIEESGKYICKVDVDIPVHVQMEGNGTVITVVPRGISDGKTVLHTFGDGAWEPVMIYTLRCLPIIVLIITFSCVYRWKVKAQHSPWQSGHFSPKNRIRGKRQNKWKQQDKWMKSDQTVNC